MEKKLGGPKERTNFLHPIVTTTDITATRIVVRLRCSGTISSKQCRTLIGGVIDRIDSGVTTK